MFYRQFDQFLLEAQIQELLVNPFFFDMNYHQILITYLK